MAYVISWTNPAEADLEEILQYVSAHGSVPSAVRVLEEIMAAVDRLRDFPFSGRVAKNLKNPALRQVFALDYRIIYRIMEGDVVEISMIIHTRREFPPKEEMYRLQ